MNATCSRGRPNRVAVTKAPANGQGVGRARIDELASVVSPPSVSRRDIHKARRWFCSGLEWLRGVFRPRLIQAVSVSCRGKHSVALCAELLANADEKFVVLVLRWPRWERGGGTPGVRVWACLGRAEEGGEKRAGGPAEWGLGPPARVECRIQQQRIGKISRVRVYLPELTSFESGEVQLLVEDGRRGTLVGRLGVRLLTALETQTLFQESLQVESVGLWARNRAGYQPGDLLAGTSEWLIPEFRLAACQIGRFTPEIGEDLKLILKSHNRAISLEDLRLKLGSQGQVCRGSPISLQDRRLIPGAGIYEIESYLGRRRLATARFRVLSDAEILEQVTVPELQIEAETRDGQVVPGLKILRWEEHQAFRPILRLASAVPAPNTLARCIVRTLQGTTLLRREELMIPLDRPVRRVALERMELGSGLPVRPRLARLVISVCIAGKVKGSVPVVILPPERITNFEGQLTFEAEELPFDPMEYQQIIQRLGLRDDLPGPGRWRAWLEKIKFASLRRTRSEGARAESANEAEDG